MSVRDSISDPSNAKVSVYAIGEKIRFSTRWKVKIGRKAVMMIAFEKRIGRPIPSVIVARRCRFSTDARNSKSRRRSPADSPSM